jgi:hypothetical protein
MQPTILDRLAQRVSLRTDDEESRLARKMRKALSKIKYKQRDSKRIQEGRGGLHSMGARGVYVKDIDIYNRRVVVKARYVVNKGDNYKQKIRDHIDYISRDDAGIEGKKAALFSEDDSPSLIKDITNKLEEAPHSFRLIISPDDGDKLDLKSFTKDLIKVLEKDLKTKLGWVASCHHDTNDPHIHVVINGKDDAGKKLLMSRDYISRGIRNRASEKITQKLGLRDIKDIINILDIDAGKSLKCHVDEIINRNIKDGCITPSKIKNEDLGGSLERILIKRLSYLQIYELSSKISNDTWSVKEEYLKDLYQIGRTSSILEKMSAVLKIDHNKCEIISTKSLSEKSIVGRVVSRGYVYEMNDAEYLVLKADQHKHIYVELEKYSEKRRVIVGDFVKINITKPFDGPKSSDQSINEIAKAHGGIYDVAVHEEYARTKKKLPPGVSTQEFIQVHLKRLELLAKIGLVERINDKSFSIPHDFIESITTKMQASAQKYKPHIKVTHVSGPMIDKPTLGQKLKL